MMGAADMRPVLGAIDENQLMRCLGDVSTEGGPLLIADHAIAKAWAGIDGDGRDYSRACEVLDGGDAPGAMLQVSTGSAVIWDMPTGTAEIWRESPDHLCISRPWLSPNDADDQSKLLARLPSQVTTPIGRFEVTSGWIVIVWAAESGRDYRDVEPTDGRCLNLSVGAAGIIVALPPGHYQCRHDEVREPSSMTNRCFIAPIL